MGWGGTWKYPDKCLREKRDFSSKVFRAAKYAKYDASCKPLYFNDLSFLYKNRRPNTVELVSKYTVFGRQFKCIW